MFGNSPYLTLKKRWYQRIPLVKKEKKKTNPFTSEKKVCLVEYVESGKVEDRMSENEVHFIFHLSCSVILNYKMIFIPKIPPFHSPSAKPSTPLYSC